MTDERLYVVFIWGCLFCSVVWAAAGAAVAWNVIKWIGVSMMAVRECAI